MVRRWGVTAALLALLGPLVACGDDDSAAASKGHGGKDRDGGAGSDAQAGDGGADGQKPGRDGGGGGGGTSDHDGGASGGGGDGTGDFSSIWKRVSSQITIIDPADPTSIVMKTIEIPALIPEPIEGHDIDAYEQIKGDKLLTYAHRDGDDVYYVLSADLMKADTTYIAIAGDDQKLLTLQDGHLNETRAFRAANDITVSTIATFNAYDGDFPPKGWPTQKIEAP